MPYKSRHGKGKHPHHSKKSKALQRQATMASQQPATAEMPQRAVPASTPVPKAAAATAKVRTIQFPYITAELRRIGILAAIIIVVLIILSIVLS